MIFFNVYFLRKFESFYFFHPILMIFLFAKCRVIWTS